MFTCRCHDASECAVDNRLRTGIILSRAHPMSPRKYPTPTQPPPSGLQGTPDKRESGLTRPYCICQRQFIYCGKFCFTNQFLQNFPKSSFGLSLILQITSSLFIKIADKIFFSFMRSNFSFLIYLTSEMVVHSQE